MTMHSGMTGACAGMTMHGGNDGSLCGNDNAFGNDVLPTGNDATENLQLTRCLVRSFRRNDFGRTDNSGRGGFEYLPGK